MISKNFWNVACAILSVLAIILTPFIVKDSVISTFIQLIILVLMFGGFITIIWKKTSKGENVDYKKLFYLTFLGLIVTSSLYLYPFIKKLII
jgi:uncharacterized membrane protein